MEWDIRKCRSGDGLCALRAERNLTARLRSALLAAPPSDSSVHAAHATLLEQKLSRARRLDDTEGPPPSQLGYEAPDAPPPRQQHLRRSLEERLDEGD
ncbi:hypothetical protein GQ55_5G509300 [Panicum hallii var. hallii]|uniref:Uncharacterized protein n=1 Tax=Panicum hallii var. hallii TaxID=1504633 RepID=A0A2T7DS94_9POAL|nr:hypothetical protein GQ55_5G509300 [Panicum hallii var. hallii]